MAAFNAENQLEGNIGAGYFAIGSDSLPENAIDTFSKITYDFSISKLTEKFSATSSNASSAMHSTIFLLPLFQEE
jgi:hypothetical protein